MENLKNIISDYLIFVIVFAVFLVVIYLLAFMFSKPGSKKSIYLYGLVLDYKTNELWALTLYVLNYLFVL